MPSAIRILLFSSLFPSAARPIHGIFVETRLRELLKTGQVEAKVIAPVPLFPFKGERFGEYGLFAATPRFAQRNGLDVYHPRYLLPPKVGMNIAPHTMALAANCASATLPTRCTRSANAFWQPVKSWATSAPRISMAN